MMNYQPGNNYLYLKNKYRLMGGSGFAYEAVKRVLQNLEWKKGLSAHHNKIMEAYRNHPSLNNVEYKPDVVSPEELLEIEKIDREARRNRIKGTIFWTFVIMLAIAFVTWVLWHLD